MLFSCISAASVVGLCGKLARSPWLPPLNLEPSTVKRCNFVVLNMLDAPNDSNSTFCDVYFDVVWMNLRSSF